MHSWTACWRTIWSLSLVDCHHWFQLHSSILYLDSDENHGQKRLCWTPCLRYVTALCSGRLDGHGYNCPPLLAGRPTSHRKRKVHLSPHACHFCAWSSLATIPRLPWKQHEPQEQLCYLYQHTEHLHARSCHTLISNSVSYLSMFILNSAGSWTRTSSVLRRRQASNS